MTKEEAEKKWCPMVRFSPHKDSIICNNRGGQDGMADLLCISEKCMWWDGYGCGIISPNREIKIR